MEVVEATQQAWRNSFGRLESLFEHRHPFRVVTGKQGLELVRQPGPLTVEHDEADLWPRVRERLVGLGQCIHDLKTPTRQLKRQHVDANQSARVQ